MEPEAFANVKVNCSCLILKCEGICEIPLLPAVLRYLTDGCGGFMASELKK